MKITNLTLILTASLIAGACSSAKTYFEESEHKELKKDYKVKDASFTFRPGWIESPSEWAKRKDITPETKLFVAESHRDDLEMSCALSKANVLKKVAEHEKYKTEYNFKGESTNAPSQTISRESYVLKETVVAEVSKTKVLQEYWEKREMDSGEIIYSCAYLVGYNE